MTADAGIGLPEQAAATGGLAMRSPSAKQSLGIGLVGHGFMGAVHSLAWRTAPHMFPLPCELSMKVVCGRDLERARDAAAKLGWQSAVSDWREVILRPDVDIVDICAPPHLHAEVAAAALEAGKHVLCEKPLANSVDDALAMTVAARRGRVRGIRSMVGYNYRRVPALAVARQLVHDGTIGGLRRVRASYLQDWACSSGVMHSWRFDRSAGGSGALGDLGCHLVDLLQYLCADRIQRIACVKMAGHDPGVPVNGPGDQLPGTDGGPLAAVDDTAVLLGISAGGFPVTFDISRVARGYKNCLRFEIDGARGTLRFDLERMNELEFFGDGVTDSTQGFRRMVITEPDHPYLSGWWPPGHVLGFEHAFVNQVRDFVLCITSGSDPAPSFEDGLAVQHVIAAAEASGDSGSVWMPVAEGQ